MQPWRMIEFLHRDYQFLPFGAQELIAHDQSPANIYVIDDKGPQKKILLHQQIEKEELKNLILKKEPLLWIDIKDKSLLLEAHQEALRNAVRKISVGDPWENARAACSLLTHNLRYLYEDPSDDQRLALQYQSARSFANFLINNPNLHPRIYQFMLGAKFHFIFLQPLLSSIFTLGALKFAKIYSDKEIESLFLTSYFKDIGMSVLAREKWDSPQLTGDDKVHLKSHPQYSIKILSGRIALTSNYLKIIEAHHVLVSPLEEELRGDNTIVAGNETALVTIMDIIAAMIAERPYRKASTVFAALELAKNVIAEQYPQEFRLLVSYFKNFFLK